MQSQTLRPSPNRPVRRLSVRTGFSLIELVVVILIIAILASLILNGVMAARTTALNAAAASDIKNIEKAISDFKLKFGMEPPSEIFLYETPAGWAANTNNARRSRAFIRQIWPQFDFSMPIAPAMVPADPNAFTTPGRDINGDKDLGDVIHLTGAEALVFFLGGMNATNVVDSRGLLRTSPVAPATSAPNVGDVITHWEPLGFSVSPTDPFARGGSRIGPYFEIESDRLINIDNPAVPTDAEGAPEYLDTLPGQTKPLIYASSYDGRGYRAVDLVTGPSSTLTSVYTKTGGQAYNPKSFQIISPGFDSDYGTGGVFDTTLPANRSMERDNITNFKGGRLE